MRSLAIAASLLLYPAAVAAHSTTYEFIGTVTAVGGAPVSVGQQVPIVVVVDRSYPADVIARGQVQYQGGSASRTADPILSATINGVSVTGSTDGMFIEKNVRHQSEIAVYVANPEPGAGLSLDFSSKLPGVVHDLAIPQAIMPGNFQSARFNYFSGPPSYYGYSGTLSLAPLKGTLAR